MGHSAGAQLAALICTDEKYLKAEGVPLSDIRGCVPVDGDTFDVPSIIETAETRRRVHGLPQAKVTQPPWIDGLYADIRMALAVLPPPPPPPKPKATAKKPVSGRRAPAGSARTSRRASGARR